jgi:flagellar biosynthesis anti-sigma factor FlgM
MKIENDKPNGLTGAAEALNPTAPAGPSAAAPKTPASQNRSDQVTLSREAQLLKAAAADAASGDPAVRSDVVERMRALLAEGKIGADATRLAEALIDDVLKHQ